MLFRTPWWLCLMILSIFFFTTTSSQEIVCYIRENLIPKKAETSIQKDDFWGYLPKEKCTIFIFVVEDFERKDLPQYMSALKSLDTNVQLGVLVSKFSIQDMVTYAYQWVEEYFTGIHFLWDERYDDPYTPEQRKDAVEFARSQLSSGKTVSQGVECKPILSTSLNKSKVAMDVDMTIVHVRVIEDNVHTYLQDPGMCVKPLLELGIPTEQIVIGLNEVLFNTERNMALFSRHCKALEKRKFLTEICRMLSCMVKFESLNGVMVWSISTDDFTGEVCKMGKYPLVTYYKLGLQYCEDYEKKEFSSGAVMIKSLISTPGITVVALVLLCDLLYALF